MKWSTDSECPHRAAGPTQYDKTYDKSDETVCQSLGFLNILFFNAEASYFLWMCEIQIH